MDLYKFIRSTPVLIAAVCAGVGILVVSRLQYGVNWLVFAGLVLIAVALTTMSYDYLVHRKSGLPLLITTALGFTAAYWVMTGFDAFMIEQDGNVVAATITREIVEEGDRKLTYVYVVGAEEYRFTLNTEDYLVGEKLRIRYCNGFPHLHRIDSETGR